MKRSVGTLGLVALGLVAAGPVRAADWSGPYVGLNAGYGWGVADTRFTGLPSPGAFVNLGTTTVKPKPDGAVAGAQLGYNWTSGKLVYGLEGDVDWSGMKGTKKVTPIIQNNGTPFGAGSYLSAGQETQWFSTLRGRIGFAPSENWLAYFTGGLAGADVKYTANTDFRPVGTTQYPASFTKNKLGWTAGLGAEWALARKWSAKLEYLYYDLGRETRKVNPLPANPPFQVENRWDTQAHIVRLGVNYHWGAPAPVAVAPPPPPPPVVVEEVKPVEPPPPPPPPPPAPVEEAKPVVAPPPPPPPPKKIVLDQAVLHFANSRNELSPEGADAVRKVAQELKTYPGQYSLVVSGHTSSTGSKAFNKALSKRRADAVAKVLEEEGIPAASIETVGVGPDQPIADNKTPEGQARNRRVEIDVKVADGSVEKRTIVTGTQDAPAPVKKKKAKKPTATN